MPTGKVTVAALVGAFVTIMLTEAARRGITIDGNEGAAITTILSFAASYFTPSSAVPPGP